MKPQVADWQTRTLCLQIIPKTGQIIRLTQYPRDLTMSNGNVYKSTVGYEFTGYSATDGFSPSSIDFEGIAGFAGIGRDQIISGVYDNARCKMFATSWINPVEDYEPILASILGKATMQDDRYKIEEMSLIDALNQSVGGSYTSVCQKTFGSTVYAGCKKTPVVVTGTITTVVSQTVFSDTSRGQVADFFTEGTIKFTSGLNAGLKPIEIKAYGLNGAITVHEPFYYKVAVGDAYSMTEGCQKRLQDCKAKNNILNFGGFSYIPTTSQYTDRGTN